jgi:Uma2 family endonuclease
MSRVAERSRVSAAEYLVWEREQPIKHEFYDGDVFAMAGGSPRHNALCVKVSAALLSALAGRGCTTLSSDQRIGLRRQKYVYPDVSVVCGEVKMEDGASDVVLNPSVLVEVLSASTEQYDRGGKWDGYRRVPSLTDYVLVAQSKPQIELFRRQDGGVWSYQAFGAGERATLSDGTILDVDFIFDGVMQLPGDDEPGGPSLAT